jgi:hypothetical protein
MNHTRQLTVYSNTVRTPKKNLMILPVPYPHSVQFEPGSYRDLFTDINSSFYKTTLDQVWATRNINTSTPLPIYNVGSYQVSIAMSVQDILRADRTLFSNLEELVEILQDDYHSPFGFLLCVLKEGGASYEPLVYTHNLYKGELFVPTKHYHPSSKGRSHMQSFTHDWDHKIFSLGTPLCTETHSPSSYMPYKHNSLKWFMFPQDFQWGNGVPLRRLEIKGGYKNIDIHLPLTSRPALPYTPLFKGIEKGLRGFFNRRRGQA